MTPIAIGLALLCQLFLVSGQLMLKRGMGATPVRIQWVVGGIASLTVWFFAWMHLLRHWQLSRIYPFEGLNPALIVIGSALFLHEHVNKTAWTGVLLISAGIAIIAS